MRTIDSIEDGCNTPSLGSLIDDILVRMAEFALFPAAADDSERKQAIMAAHSAGEITGRQASMLIARFGLRGA